MNDKKTLLKKTINITLVFLPVILVLSIWIIKSKNNSLNTSIIPTPEKIWQALRKLVTNGSLQKHIIASFSRVLKGYFIGITAGFIIGILAALFVPVEKLMVTPTGFLRSIPPIALIPFFILWMGIGEATKISVITFGCFWPVLLNTISGIRTADKKLIEVGTSLCKSRFEIFIKVILPSALPSVLTGLRLANSSAWNCVVASEMIAASAGLGFLITFSREMANPASLMVGVFTIGLFGVAIDYLFRKLNNKLIFW